MCSLFSKLVKLGPVMRWMVAAGIVAFAALSAAVWAQEPEPPAIQWLKKPTGEDFARNYPADAARNGIAGASVLCCTPQNDGSIQCKTNAELPADSGFGDAAVKVSRAFRMSASEVQAWRSRGEPVRVPITFLAGDAGNVEQAREAMRAFVDARKDVCKKGAASGL